MRGLRAAAAGWAAALLVTATPAAVRAQAPPPRTLIAVPYLAQTPELCGGAALAMVLRYWGDAHAAPQDFAALVSRSDGGIRTDVLTGAARARGWQASAGRATGSGIAEIDAHLARGRPVIALIEDRPDVFHYVVVVARTTESVVVHDPARSPFRVLPAADFDRRWAESSRWMLLVLPPVDRSAPRPIDGAVLVKTGAAPAARPCDALIRRSIDLAHEGDMDGAERGLVTATGLCPADAAPWRELAGLRLLQARWPDVRRFAEHAVAIAPGDRYAWQLLGTARFVADDTAGALDAWNRAGEPRVDSVDVVGADRTRHPVIVDLTGLTAGELLTSDSLELATRRVQQLPTAKSAAVHYTPAADGDAAVQAIVQEKSLMADDLMDWAGIGARVVLKHELKMELAGPTGSGEVWSGAWRWQRNRPRVAFGLSLPAPGPLPGILSIDGLWERQAYALSSGAAGAPIFHENRRRGGVQLSDWITSRLRWQAGAALDTIMDRSHVAIDGSADLRMVEDLVSAAVSIGVWTPLQNGERFTVTDGSVAWRANRQPAPPLSGIVGVTIASQSAPFAVWPSAGTGGSGRGAYLRAHPLHDSGVIISENFARRLAYFTVEHQRPLPIGPAGKMTGVVFIDGVRAWDGLPGRPRRINVDVGGGVRFGSGSGTVRLEVGYGLRDQQWAISAGWVNAWPGR